MKVIISIFILAISLSASAEYVPRPGPDASEVEKTVYQLNKSFMRRMHSTNRFLAVFKKKPKLDVGELAASVDTELKALEKLAEYSEDQIPEAYSNTIKKRTSFLGSILVKYSEYFEKHSERYKKFKHAKMEWTDKKSGYIDAPTLSRQNNHLA